MKKILVWEALNRTPVLHDVQRFTVPQTGFLKSATTKVLHAGKENNLPFALVPTFGCHAKLEFNAKLLKPGRLQ